MAREDVQVTPAPLIRVAVLGSCVSRDLFNRQFNPSYKDLFDCVALSNQVSLISLMSEPITVRAEQLADLDEYGQREVTKEISRSFLEDLVAQRPEYLLVDLFADVHLGCFEVDGRHLTRNRWRILKTRLYAESDSRDLVPDDDREAYLVAWRDAVDRLLGFLAENLPETRVVLHRARNVTHTVDGNGIVTAMGQERRMRAMNEWWNRLDDELVSRGVTRTIDVFREDLTSFDTHPWGPFAVHYTLDYHGAALSRLTQIVLTDARSVTPGRPAARLGPVLHRAWGGLSRTTARRSAV
jgi:hypothetical protein